MPECSETTHIVPFVRDKKMHVCLCGRLKGKLAQTKSGEDKAK